MRTTYPVGEHRRTSVHVHDGVSEDDSVAMRDQRDAGLSVPKLLLPSIQLNIRAGHFDEAEANGITYLRIPVKWQKLEDEANERSGCPG